jgi:hypothetical protein
MSQRDEHDVKRRDIAFGVLAARGRDRHLVGPDRVVRDGGVLTQDRVGR